MLMMLLVQHFGEAALFGEYRRANKIGGREERCAVDEAAVGKVDGMTGKPPQPRGGNHRAKVRIGAKLCKMQSARAGKAQTASTGFDKRSNEATQWLHADVE